MSTKHHVYLAQVNFRYGDNVFIPYSAGAIQAYCNTDSEIRANFLFQEPKFLRENPDEVIRSMDRPAVVGLSCYVWNWAYSKRLAECTRAAYPDALIVLGGPHVPEASEDFFSQHPYVDILVHNEGELTFADILRQFLDERPGYTKIQGLSVKGERGETIKTQPRARIHDLSILPSPYLEGVFDFLLDRDYVLNASQETNRGCPYSCAYCDWGSAAYTKIRQFDEARIIDEFHWFGKHRVEYVFNCDANYGILARDYDLTMKMTEIRRHYGGYPKRFRMCTAKNSNEKIFAITKWLNDADMNKGATLSFQSMDGNVLGNILRKNIGVEVFAGLMRQYREAGIATYTELILGLPGETYESFKQGIDTLIEAESDVNLYVYLCILLPNSEMSRPGYLARHGIKSAPMPVLLAHSTPMSEMFQEYHNVVFETSSMSHEDWRRSYVFAWAIQCFHCLGLLRQTAILFRREFDISYSTFYASLVDYFGSRSQTSVGKQLGFVSLAVAESTRGGRLDAVLPKFGDICWPLEEASFISFVDDKATFYREIHSFVGELARALECRVDNTLLDELVLYQSSIVVDPFVSRSAIKLEYNLHDYFLKQAPLSLFKSSPSIVTIVGDRDFAGDVKEYAKQVVWYGRKGGRFHHSKVTVNTSLGISDELRHS